MPTTKLTSLTELLEATVTSRMADTYHMLPGLVVKYYPDTSEADLQIAINDPRFDPETDELETEPWPIYPRVRVAWPRFGGMIIQGPLSVGDNVEVYFQDLDDSAFRTTNQQGDPPRTRRHGSDGAYCLPWCVTDAGQAADHTAASTALVIGKDGAEAQIRIGATTISLGATGVDWVALSSKVDAIIAKLDKTIRTDWTPVPNDGGAALRTAYLAEFTVAPTSVASAVVKVD